MRKVLSWGFAAVLAVGVLLSGVADGAINNPSPVIISTPPQGRLTLTTATPVMTTTVSAASTIYYTPYVGSIVPIYTGTNFTQVQCAELTNATAQSSTGSAGPSAVANNSVYDLFVWSNAGICTLTRGPAWTDSTTRSAGTALVRQSGIWLNNATITNGPAASRGTYVGTVASNGTATIDYIFGAAASGGTASRLMVWNAYNRVSTSSYVTDAGTPYNYTSNTVRQARASAGNQIAYVQGLAEEAPTANYMATSQTNATAAISTWGIGFDSTSAYSCVSGAAQDPVTGAGPIGLGVFCAVPVDIGVHVVSANEGSDGANANSFDVFSLNRLTLTIRN